MLNTKTAQKHPTTGLQLTDRETLLLLPYIDDNENSLDFLIILCSVANLLQKALFVLTD